jgi:hypothetical protein
MNATTNLSDLNAILPLYQQLSGKSAQDVLSKQGGKLARNIYFRLRAIMPAKGSIRSQALAALASGRMIKIRPSVLESLQARVLAKGSKVFKTRASTRQKQGISRETLNVPQELVRREIAVRESGRGVLSRSSKYPSELAEGQRAVSRYGSLFSQVGLKLTTEEKYVQIMWPGISTQSQNVIKGIQRPRGHAAVAEAIAMTRDDILVYVSRKQAELARKVVRALVKK